MEIYQKSFGQKLGSETGIREDDSNVVLVFEFPI